MNKIEKFLFDKCEEYKNNTGCDREIIIYMGIKNFKIYLNSLFFKKDLITIGNDYFFKNQNGDDIEGVRIRLIFNSGWEDFCKYYLNKINDNLIVLRGFHPFSDNYFLKNFSDLIEQISIIQLNKKNLEI